MIGNSSYMAGQLFAELVPIAVGLYVGYKIKNWLFESRKDKTETTAEKEVS